MLALVLLARSLFAETAIFLRKAPRTLVTTGSYSLSRHPGALWLLLLHSGLLLLSCSRLLLLALPLWTALNILLIALEDRFFFPHIFGPGYRSYATQVPFLLPTRASLGRYLFSVLSYFEKGEQNGKDD